MASLYGVNETLRRSVPSSKIPEGEQAGRLRVAYDTYELVADVASGDVLYLSKIPKGARVIQVLVGTDDLDGSGGTLDIGWAASADGVEAADPDGFLANIDVATAADNFDMLSNKAGPIDGVFKKFASEVQLTVTFDGDTDATSGTISVVVQYVLD